MASDVSICNGALIKLGAARITSLNQSTVEAKLCKERYDENRRDLLRSHPWNFATVWGVPAELVTTESHRYTYVYQLPSDCLRVVETSIPTDNWRVEGESTKILTADIPIEKVRYIKDVTDANMMDPNFREALSCKIAVDLCYSLVQSATLRQSLQDEFKQTLRTARSFNGQEGAPPRVYADSWLNSRR